MLPPPSKTSPSPRPTDKRPSPLASPANNSLPAVLPPPSQKSPLPRPGKKTPSPVNKESSLPLPTPPLSPPNNKSRSSSPLPPNKASIARKKSLSLPAKKSSFQPPPAKRSCSLPLPSVSCVQNTFSIEKLLSKNEDPLAGDEGQVSSAATEVETSVSSSGGAVNDDVTVIKKIDIDLADIDKRLSTITEELEKTLSDTTQSIIITTSNPLTSTVTAILPTTTSTSSHYSSATRSQYSSISSPSNSPVYSQAVTRDHNELHYHDSNDISTFNSPRPFHILPTPPDYRNPNLPLPYPPPPPLPRHARDMDYHWYNMASRDHYMASAYNRRSYRPPHPAHNERSHDYYRFSPYSSAYRDFRDRSPPSTRPPWYR